MISQFKMYENIIMLSAITILTIGLYLYVGSLKDQIRDLKYNLKSSQVDLVNYKLESARYKNIIYKQNKDIELLKINEKLSLTKLKKWKNESDKVKYKTIYKIREVHSDDCKAIKDQLTAIKLINFDKL